MPVTETLYRLAYLSRNLLPPEASDAAIRQILAAARRRNAALGLTGALLFSADAFAQVLEGPEAAVRSLYHRIEADPRHADPLVVGAGPIAARAFGAWSMGYIGPSPEIDARFAAITAEDRGAHAGPRRPRRSRRGGAAAGDSGRPGRGRGPGLERQFCMQEKLALLKRQFRPNTALRRRSVNASSVVSSAIRTDVGLRRPEPTVAAPCT